MRSIHEYSLPVRLGLKTRKILRRFGSSYGGKYIAIRRPVAVFINTLLDTEHQETFKGTIHDSFNK